MRSTVKGFSIVNEAEVDVFLELSCFFSDPMDVGNLISGSSAFSKSSLNIWKFTVHILLKPSLKDFEHYFASVWDECNCAVFWTFFDIAFLWDWNEKWPSPVLRPLLSLPNLLAYWVWHFHSIRNTGDTASGDTGTELLWQLIPKLASFMLRAEHRQLNLELLLWTTLWGSHLEGPSFSILSSHRDRASSSSEMVSVIRVTEHLISLIWVRNLFGKNNEMKPVHNASVLVMRSSVQSMTWGSEFLMMLRQMRWTLTWPGSRLAEGEGSRFATNLSQALLPPTLPSFSQPCLPSFPLFI